MSQQGQLIRLKRTAPGGEPLWSYRYRVGGRDSKRVQHGAFLSERDAAGALERELERLRRERRVSKSLTLGEGPDAAVGSTMLIVFMNANGTQSSLPFNVGEDHDRFVHTEHGWRFVSSARASTRSSLGGVIDVVCSSLAFA